ALAQGVLTPPTPAHPQLGRRGRRPHRHTDDPRLTEPTELAQKEIERLTMLLNEFLIFARPPELHSQEHDVVAIVRQVADLERLAVERRGASLELSADPAPLLAEVDAAKLHQLVSNLVRNASEAIPTG